VARYEFYEPSLAPTWLQDDVAQDFFTAQGLARDVLAQRVNAALAEHLIQFCSPDAVGYPAHERGLEPAPGESVEALRARVLDAWHAWAGIKGSRGGAGTYDGLMGQLAPYAATVSIKRNWEWDGNGHPEAWWQFWVVLQPGGAYTADWAESGDRARQIKRIIARWRGAHEICVNITVIFGGELWDFATTAPGLWDDPMGVWTDDTSSIYVWGA